VVKSRSGGLKLVVGEEIRVEQIWILLGKTLVGKFMGHGVSMGWLNDWFIMKWVLFLGYGLFFHMLAKEWIGIFFSALDANSLKGLKGNWLLDWTQLSLKPWHPCFNAMEESMSTTPLWVKMQS
jgi:hypothetical protein